MARLLSLLTAVLLIFTGCNMDQDFSAQHNEGGESSTLVEENGAIPIADNKKEDNGSALLDEAEQKNEWANQYSTVLVSYSFEQELQQEYIEPLKNTRCEEGRSTNEENYTVEHWSQFAPLDINDSIIYSSFSNRHILGSLLHVYSSDKTYVLPFSDNYKLPLANGKSAAILHHLGFENDAIVSDVD